MPNEKLKKAVEQRLNSDRSPCQELLGDEIDVAHIAQIWKSMKGPLKLAEAGLLLDFCKTKVFTKDEFEAYKLGLESWCKLFEACEIELDNRMEMAKEAQEAKKLENLENYSDPGIMQP